MILAAHTSGEINLHSMSLKDISKTFGCCESTSCLARKLARKEDKVKPPRYRWQIVVDAHNEGRVDLNKSSDKKAGEALSVHHSVVARARQELGIVKKNDPSKKKENPYAWYWYRWRKEYGVFKTWGVIPERVGLTKNQWLSRNEDRS